MEYKQRSTELVFMMYYLHLLFESSNVGIPNEAATLRGMTAGEYQPYVVFFQTLYHEKAEHLYCLFSSSLSSASSSFTQGSVKHQIELISGISGQKYSVWTVVKRIWSNLRRIS